jgi:hypothetical protein
MKLRRIDYLRNRFRPNCFAASLLFTLCLPTLAPLNLRAQQLPIDISSDPTAHAITITAAGRPFATFIYPDTLPKPVLYPIYAPDGQLITRGFPLNPRSGEPVDHPHHIGLWFNYENVNGLDFWNNSYAIPVTKRSKYGWIRTDSILEPRTTGNTTGPRSVSSGSNTLRYTSSTASLPSPPSPIPAYPSPTPRTAC